MITTKWTLFLPRLFTCLHFPIYPHNISSFLPNLTNIVIIVIKNRPWEYSCCSSLAAETCDRKPWLLRCFQTSSHWSFQQIVIYKILKRWYYLRYKLIQFICLASWSILRHLWALYPHSINFLSSSRNYFEICFHEKKWLEMLPRNQKLRSSRYRKTDRFPRRYVPLGQKMKSIFSNLYPFHLW